MKNWTEESLIAAGYEIKNEVITSADLSTENYSVLDMPIVLNGNGWGVCYGGYALGKGGSHAKIESIEGSKKGMEAILTIMNVIGVDSFKALENKYVRVATKGWGDTIKIIGNIIEDKWFDYGTFFTDEDEKA